MPLPTQSNFEASLLEEAQNRRISHSPLTVFSLFTPVQHERHPVITLPQDNIRAAGLSPQNTLEPLRLVGAVHNTLWLWGLKLRP